MTHRVVYPWLIALIISGCCTYMPNDLMFEVEGTAPIDAGCELELLYAGESASPAQPVAGEFHSVFWVSFCEHRYTLQAVCNGKVVYENDVIFPGKKATRPYDMGKLDITPKNAGDGKH